MSDLGAVIKDEDGKRDWQMILFFCAVTAAIIAVAAATVGVVIAKDAQTEVAVVKKTVEHSACQERPASVACQKAKARSSRDATVATTCIGFWKVGYPCPKPGSEAAERLEAQAAKRAAREVMPSSPSTGNSLPGLHGSGGSRPREVDGGGVGVKKSPEFLSPPSRAESAGGESPSVAPTSTSSQQSSSQTTERTTETAVVEAPPATPVRSAVGGLTEGLGSTVQETGSTVNGSVESVTGSTCSLAKVLC